MIVVVWYEFMPYTEQKCHKNLILNDNLVHKCSQLNRVLVKTIKYWQSRIIILYDYKLYDVSNLVT